MSKHNSEKYAYFLETVNDLNEKPLWIANTKYAITYETSEAYRLAGGEYIDKKLENVKYIVGEIKKPNDKR